MWEILLPKMFVLHNTACEENQEQHLTNFLMCTELCNALWNSGIGTRKAYLMIILKMVMMIDGKFKLLEDKILKLLTCSLIMSKSKSVGLILPLWILACYKSVLLWKQTYGNGGLSVPLPCGWFLGSQGKCLQGVKVSDWRDKTAVLAENWFCFEIGYHFI